MVSTRCPGDASVAAQYREGVDDIRYLTTLLDTIEEAEKSKDPKTKSAVSKAKNYLKRLKDNDINKAKSDLGTIRSEMIHYILKLTGKRKLRAIL